jgi:hypothetical protein
MSREDFSSEHQIATGTFDFYIWTNEKMWMDFFPDNLSVLSILFFALEWTDDISEVTFVLVTYSLLILKALNLVNCLTSFVWTL